MTRPLRLGVIGAGRVGQIAHLAHYAQLPGVELALADIRPELLALVAERWNIARCFADHRAMLAAGVDAVVVVVRRPATGPVVLDALRAGVHVLSEKPMALTVPDAATLLAAAERSQCKYGVAYMKRHDAGVAVFRERLALRVADGSLGDLLELQAWSRGGADGSQPADFLMTAEARPDGLATWPLAPAWLPADAAEAYEELLNVHSHLTNLVRLVDGGPAALRSVRRTGPATMIHARTAAGLDVTFELCDGRRLGPWDEGVAARFSRGELRADLPAPFAVDAAAMVRESTDAGVTHVPVEPGGGAFARQACAFIAWLRDEVAFASPAADGREDLAFAAAVWQELRANAALQKR